MSSFKDFVAEDNNKVFFNTNEFAEVHNINDVECTIVFTNEKKVKADNKINDDYINTESFSFLIEKDKLGFKPDVDSMIKLDSQMYIVIDVIENMLTFELFLDANVR